MSVVEPTTLFSMLTNGNEQQFICEYWRTQTLFRQGCIPTLAQYYSAEQFLQDYRRLDCHSATYLISISEEKERQFSVPSDWQSVERALANGASMAMLAMNLPNSLERVPATWGTFLSLHHSLREYLCRDFPVPPNSRAHSYLAISSVDFFYTSSHSQEVTTGGHYDTGDVFYFVLEGEKEWTVELRPDSKTTKSLVALPGGVGNLTNADRSPQREFMKVTLRPGDCLYVPPYTYHRVRSNGRSLAVSLGLPTYNEVTLLAHHIIRLQMSQQLYEPLPSFPEAYREYHFQAKEETRSRMMTVLAALSETFR